MIAAAYIGINVEALPEDMKKIEGVVVDLLAGLYNFHKLKLDAVRIVYVDVEGDDINIHLVLTGYLDSCFKTLASQIEVELLEIGFIAKVLPADK